MTYAYMLELFDYEEGGDIIHHGKGYTFTSEE